MKGLSFLLLSSAEAPYTSHRLPSLIFSSFVSPLLSPFNPFSFPPPTSSFLYSCFHFNPISQSSTQPLFCSLFRQALSHFLHLSVISSPFITNFLSDCSHHRNVPFYWHILGLFSLTHLRLFCQCKLPSPQLFIAKPPMDQLSPPA